MTLLGTQPVLAEMTAFPGRTIGEVEQLDDGLFVEFLPRPPTLDASANCIVDFEAWTTVLAKALAKASRGTASLGTTRPQ